MSYHRPYPERHRPHHPPHHRCCYCFVTTGTHCRAYRSESVPNGGGHFERGLWLSKWWWKPCLCLPHSGCRLSLLVPKWSHDRCLVQGPRPACYFLASPTAFRSSWTIFFSFQAKCRNLCLEKSSRIWWCALWFYHVLLRFTRMENSRQRHLKMSFHR